MGLCGIRSTVLLLIFISESLANSDTTGDNKTKVKWIKPGILTHQSLHSVLVSMEEQLRGLEDIKYTVQGIDVYLKSFSRKLESLDVRTRAVQIKLEQLEVVTQTMISQEIKNDLSISLLQRNFKINQDRLLHQISLTENRLDSSITKFQGAIDIGFENIDKKQIDYQNKLHSLNAGLDDISTRLLKVEGNTNTTTYAVQQHRVSGGEESRHGHMNRISAMLEGIEKHVNRSLMLSEQSDSPKKNRKEDDKLKEIIRTELHSESNRIGNKINNMYRDLWGKTLAIESLIKDGAFASNATELKLNNQPKTEDVKCYETIQSVMRETLGTLGSELQEKVSKVDVNVENLFGMYKMILGVYNNMRDEGNQFETKLTYVLGKILETIENRTMSVDESQKKTLDALKTHNNQIARTVAYNTNFLRKMAEDTGVEHKNVETALFQILSFLNPDKNESQEYEDTVNVSFRRSQEGRENREEPANSATQNQHRQLPQLKPVETKTNHSSHRDNPKNQTQDKVSHNRTQQVTFNVETLTDIDDSHYHDGHPLEDETDKMVTKLLMLYLKALKGHLSKDKFLYEANPQQPYSSVQEMINKLKEKNFPSDFLKELEEWDHETNDKEALEENMEEVKDFDNPSEDYFTDKDYLDYQSKDSP